MMNDNEAREQHDLLVQMLRDQEQLYEPQIFEPVVITRRENIKIESGVRIDSFVKLEGGQRLYIGRGVHIASFAQVGIGGGETILEDYSAVAAGARIISGSNQPDALSMSASAPKEIQRVRHYRTVLSRYSVALVNSVVGPGVTLHEGAVLAAGGVTMKDIPAWEIWGGVPARFIRKREVKR